MEFYFWSILIVMGVSYLAGLLAKCDKDYDNSAPRLYSSHLTGRRKRAYWAHQNGIEIFPVYVSAIFVAHLQSVDPAIINNVAIYFIISRVLYTCAYICDKPTMRSIFWGIGLAFLIGLFILSA